MQRTTARGPAQNQTTGTVFIFRVFLNDLSVEESLHHFVLSDVAFNTALDRMASPLILTVADLFLNEANIHPCSSHPSYKERELGQARASAGTRIERGCRGPLQACPAVAACTMTMTFSPLHRSRGPHFHEPGHYHELTFCGKRASSPGTS